MKYQLVDISTTHDPLEVVNLSYILSQEHIHRVLLSMYII